MLSNRCMPLHWAILKGYSKIAEILIENGANVNRISIEDKTPLTIACEQGDETVALQLVQNGANVYIHIVNQLNLKLAIDFSMSSLGERCTGIGFT